MVEGVSIIIVFVWCHSYNASYAYFDSLIMFHMRVLYGIGIVIRFVFRRPFDILFVTCLHDVCVMLSFC